MKQETQDKQHGRHRTAGNKLFDVLVYPSIAFGAVFSFSIWALHATKYGKGRSHAFFEETNKTLAGVLEHLPVFKNLSEETRSKEARNYASILVSFVTGTLLIHPIKWLEDRREKISAHFDRLLHTAPPDDSHYKAEPHQSWKSIYGGRAITFGTVLALGTAIGEKRTTKITESVVELVADKWKKLRPATSEATLTKVRQWTDVAAFETFYTALCATLIYGISRGLARTLNKHEKTGTAQTQPQQKSGLQGEEEQEAANARSSWQTRVRPVEATPSDHKENVILSRAGPPQAQLAIP